MKLLFTIALIYSFSAQADVQKFTSEAERGYPIDCSRILETDFYIMQTGHLKFMLSMMKDAKTKCELSTGKLCGVIEWKAVEKLNNNGDRLCVAQATATPIN